MGRVAPSMLGMLASAACAPAGPPDGAGVPSQTAADFDVGAVKAASAYLDDPEFAAADLERGRLLALACIACHTLHPGERHMLGPNLGRLFGSRAAERPGFEYSAALSATELTWTPRALDAWLAAPESFVPGTSMVFAGYSTPAERRDLIAYLLHETEVSAP